MTRENYLLNYNLAHTLGSPERGAGLRWRPFSTDRSEAEKAVTAKPWLRGSVVTR